MARRERAEMPERGPWHELRPLGAARCDAIYLEGEGDPALWGFCLGVDGVWRAPGWRAFDKRGRAGEPRTVAIADAEWCAQASVAGDFATLLRGFERMEVRRIDVCRDARFAPVSLELYDYLSGDRGSDRHERSKRVNLTVALGSRRSSVYLRIYVKAHPDKPPEKYLEDIWGGWHDEFVTRTEFELKKEAVEGLLAADICPDLIRRMWVDAMTRFRLRRGRVRDFSQAQKAGECDGWARLRDAEPDTRDRSRRAENDLVGVERHLVRLLQRYRAAGADIHACIARYENEHTALTEVDAQRARRIEKRRQRAEDAVWRLERGEPEG